MAVLKFQFPTCCSCSSSSTKHTVKTVWRAQTFAAKALSSGGQNLKSTEQTRRASDLCIPGPTHKAKVSSGQQLGLFFALSWLLIASPKPGTLPSATAAFSQLWQGTGVDFDCCFIMWETLELDPSPCANSLLLTFPPTFVNVSRACLWWTGLLLAPDETLKLISKLLALIGDNFASLLHILTLSFHVNVMTWLTCEYNLLNAR